MAQSWTQNLLWHQVDVNIKIVISLMTTQTLKSSLNCYSSTVMPDTPRMSLWIKPSQRRPVTKPKLH